MAIGIIGICCVRNEADILEAFVRHHCAILDRMLLICQESSDGSLELLQKLEREGLPLEVRTDASLYHRQKELLTLLMKEIVLQSKTDWILPLDADEFLIASKDGTLKNCLDSLPKDKVTLLPWRTYVPTPSDHKHEPNPLRRLHFRREPEGPKKYYKVLVPISILGNGRFELHAGNHRLEDIERGMGFSEKACDSLHLAHFPIRSADQITKKIVGGWLNVKADPSRLQDQSFHWEQLFNRLCLGGNISDRELYEFALGYSQPSTKLEDYQLVCEPVPVTFSLRYPIHSPTPLYAISQIALRFAEELGKRKVHKWGVRNNFVVNKLRELYYWMRRQRALRA